MEEQRFFLKKDYVDALQRLNALALILPSLYSEDFLEGYVQDISERIDGLLISGGGDIDPEYYNEIPILGAKLEIVKRQRSDFEIGLLREMIIRKKPVFGICYGMQLINVALGGSLYQDINLQINNSLSHDDSNHDIIITDNIFGLSGKFFVNSYHHQAIKGLGKDLKVWAVSGDGIIEGFYKEGYPFFVGVQWHPERIFYDKLSLKIFKTFVEKASYGAK